MANDTAGTGKKGLAKFWQYLREVRLELKKITWPTHKDTFKKTLLVLVVVVVTSVLLWGLDQLLLIIAGLIVKGV